ncbi:V-snare-domain-containing protein [Ascodesmis nigricans]|uniref:V-snare-domain-containing protein n=1 Tax=Ascodesmis nigricans TaxID=341454 RepID=A0A4S2N6L4_9PEZI|nr:V-snare-domain-containing protein [Ascodesmis nigricans]
MSDGSELFASYEADFKLLFTDLQQRLQDLRSLRGEERRAAIRNAERVIDEADELLGQMSLEVSNIPTPSRQKPRSRLRNYTSDLDSCRSTILKAAQSADRDALFGDRAGGDSGDAVTDQRQQLLSGTERLERSSQRLRDSERIARETEGIGGRVLEDLRGQRERIAHTHDTLNDSERYLDRSVKTLRGMARRMATNRMITIAIITVLVLLIIAVIFSKFR